MAEQRLEFVVLAETGSVPFAVLCRRFGIKRDTGYKWLARYRADGEAGLEDRSRAPHTSPLRTDEAMEQLVCQVRQAHPAWGGRKLRGFLLRHGHVGVPAASTITAILRRNGLLEPETPPKRDYVRFERTAPNELWQMDFKGDFKLAGGGRCYPFGVIDDYSRFSISLVACANQRTGTVQTHLAAAFSRYGLPEAILCDNAPPWGTAGSSQHKWTSLTVWLADLDVAVIHSAPFHPQTNGKKERLHLTLDLEVLNTRRQWHDHDQVQQAFEAWEPIYNHHRPHEALGETTVPADRYQPSPRSIPEQIPEPVYPGHWEFRKVDTNSRAWFRGYRFKVTRALRGRYVAFAPTTDPDTFDIYWRHHLIRTIDLSTMSPNTRPRSTRS